jgi:hypothetical protein
MVNVSVSDSIIVFRSEGPTEDTVEIKCPEYLRQRELAERAAAKRSASVSARRVHQELAHMMQVARMRFEND